MSLTRRMRASRQEQIGGAGVSEVSAAFERLGWGVAENARHDLGTDLFTLARDERLFDLGLVVGVQVKAGASYFSEPAYDSDGCLLGWWFRDDDRSHVDYWVWHGLPHLVVLHDLKSRTSYWAHVTAESVVTTGKGAKILVPRANTLDDEHREALLGVAATPLPRAVWEGSAWTRDACLAPRDLLRHALLVPRLIAPHPNAGRNVTLTPERAAALLVQARVLDLNDFAGRQPDVPSLTEARQSPQWLWRFVGELGHRLTTGEVDGLWAMVDEAPDRPTRTASAVTAAAGLMEDERVDQALSVLDGVLARDEADPVDHAWLMLQRARACADVGRIDEARAVALDVQEIRATHPNDLTATAIAGVAAVLLFNTAVWGGESVAEAVTGMDTTAAWWRTQTMSWGLAALAERTFKAWTRDATVTWSRGDAVNDRLLAASLTANYLGDHGAWRHATGLLGRDALLRLSRDADAETARRGLDTLRIAGDQDALKLAVRRLAANGPATAITLSAANVRLDASTRTTGPSALTLLQRGGDLLDQTTADRSVSWLLATLMDSSAFVARTNPSYLLDARLVDTLAGVVPAASPAAMRAVIDHLMALAGQEDQLQATSWAHVVHALPQEAWDEDVALRAAQSADSHHWALRWPLLEVAAQFDRATRTALIEEARAGSLDALAALGDVRILPTDVVTKLITVLAEHAERQLREAHGGTFGFGGHDAGHALALLNVRHQSAARWNPLLNLIQDPLVAGEHKRGALRVLASLADHLPEDIRTRLEPIAVAVAGQRALHRPVLFTEHGDAIGEAIALAVALGLREQDATDHRLLDLLGGDVGHRRWAALVARRLGRPEDTGLLVTLTQDLEPEVRAAAASGLAALVAAERGGGLAVNGLQRCLHDPGTRVPASIAATLADITARGAAAEEALAQLREHASARVRATAASATGQ
jgi:hypothetical protein